MDEPALDGITTTLGDLVPAVYQASESEEEALVVLTRLLARATRPPGRLAA